MNELKVGRRFWTYRYDSWLPDHRWLPKLGGDEYGRRTIILPIPFAGYLVWAYWTCHCSDCDEMREQTAGFQADERRDGPWCRYDDEYMCLERTWNESGLCDDHDKEASDAEH